MKFTSTQRRMLIILTLINFFNYLDRNIIFPLFHLIKVEFGLSDFQLGLLGTVFIFVHSVASVPLGILADKYSRRVIIAGGVLFWSLASFATGIVGSFRALLFTRALVGVGEASYAPAATSMLSENFPEEKRSQAQGIFNIGLFLGGTLGAILGGIIAYYLNSWRLAFLFISLPGVLLAFLTLGVKDEQKKHAPTAQHKGALKKLFTNPAYILMLVNGTFISFGAGALITWGVEFIMRYQGYDLRTGSILLGSILMVGGVLGIIIGSYLADTLQKRFVWGRAIVIGLSLIISAPFMFLGIYTGKGNIAFLIYFFLGVLFGSFYYGPATIVMHDIVPKHLRSTAYGVYLLVIHLLGDTTAPALVGHISDVYDLRVGLELAGIAILLGGISFMPICWYVMRHPKAD